jgi:hypothetical protein
MAITFGFRLADASDGSSIRLEKSLVPVGWEHIDRVPTLDMIRYDKQFGSRLAEDLPDDGITIGKLLHFPSVLVLHLNVATESFMEAVVGLEEYNVMLQANNTDMNRKMLVASWVFTHGFLNTNFPATERFIPGHMEERIRRSRRSKKINN